MESPSLLVTIQKVYYPLVSAIGIPSNLFTFYMLRFRKCGMSETANIYLSALAIMDCCCLLWVTLLDLSWTFLQGHPFWHMYPWCGLHTFLEFGAITSSIWIVVTFTLERYLVLRDPTARKHFSHARFSRRVLLLVILVSHVVSIPAYWINVAIMLNYTAVNEGNVTLSRCIYNETTFSTVVVWINTFLSGGIPFTLIIVFNSLIARQLTKASKLFTKEQQRTMKGIINRGLVRRTILLLFTVSFTFVFLCLPHFITYCILRTTYNYQDFNRDDYSQPINVAGDLAVMLQNLNYTANFLLYCVVSKQFRRELQVVASCGRKAASRQSVIQQTTMRVYSVTDPKTEDPGNHISTVLTRLENEEKEEADNCGEMKSLVMVLAVKSAANFD